MNRILLVEDDRNLALGIAYALKNEGFEVDVCSNLAAAEEHFGHQSYDLVLLDIMLPDGTGYDFCKAIRKESDVPIIFLTACDEEVNVVMGLDMGGDDYITKPFRVRELVSRIKAVLRRRGGAQGTEGDVLVSGDLQVHMLEGRVRRDAEDILLTPSEYRLLLTFLKHPHQVLSRSALLESLWDVEGEFVDDNTLSVYIRRLREKIGDAAEKPLFIFTVRGVGYKWDADVRRMRA